MLLGNIDRTPLRLNVHSCDILAENSETEKLYSADKQNQNHYGGVAGNVNPESKLLYNHGDKIDTKASFCIITAIR